MTTTSARLYRSIRREDFPDGPIVGDAPAPAVLHPSFEDKPYTQNTPEGSVQRVRPADTHPFLGKDGQMMVAPFKGTSLFDRENVFPSKFWWSFVIPEGTEVPASIVVRFTDYNKRFQANHYQIEPRAGIMRLDAYKGALDDLARCALVKYLAESKGQK